MAEPTITGATGYDNQADAVVRTMLAGGTIAKGDVVRLGLSSGDSTADGLLGIEVLACGATQVPHGIALEAGTDGGYIRVQTRGLGLVDLVTDSSGVAEGEYVYATADADTDGAAVTAVGDSNLAGRAVAYALAADATNTLEAGKYVIITPTGF
jgi:hypothetical protein